MPNIVKERYGLVSIGFTIANGESLSGAIDLIGSIPVALEMPAAWTAANLTLQGSQDGTTYNDVYDDLGTEYVITAAAARYILLDSSLLLSFRQIKVRSGTTGTPVNQGAARTLTLMARKPTTVI